jgi:hypothetical protein
MVEGEQPRRQAVAERAQRFVEIADLGQMLRRISRRTSAGER